MGVANHIFERIEQMRLAADGGGSMTYEEARAYIGKISKTGSILGLGSIRNLMRELSDVQEKLSIIHLAGTNGKGSVGAFLAAALMEAGCRVGRYTSPAVFSPLEVWQIDGVSITKEEYIHVLSQAKSACDILISKGLSQPTVFEVETAMAFLWFYQRKCDYVLLETGMGGREDATNLIRKPLCSVLTSISMDHMQFLGDTLGKIAAQKAGIIKEGCPVVAVKQKPEAMTVIEQVAREKHARLFVADAAKTCKILKKDLTEMRYSCEYYAGSTIPEAGAAEEINSCNDAVESMEETEITLHTTGSYQLENSLLALTVLRQILHIPMETIARGFSRVRWEGRFEILRKEPLFIIDGAHNPGAAEKLRQTIENYFTNCKITYIIGVLQDKNHEKMLELMLPFTRRVYTVTPENSRAMDGKLLGQEVEEVWRKLGQGRARVVTVCDTIEHAVQQSLTGAGKEDVILAWGSLSYLGQVRACVIQNDLVIENQVR